MQKATLSPNPSLGGFGGEPMSELFKRVKAIPIESVVREYYPHVDLKPRGRNLISRCPFHNEATASFYLYSEKNRWHCFGGCAKGESTIDLLLMGELASEPLDAAKMLAEKFGIETEKPKRNAKALTVAKYAEFCGLIPLSIGQISKCAPRSKRTPRFATFCPLPGRGVRANQSRSGPPQPS